MDTEKNPAAEAPTIEGTYILVSRVLPDGTELSPPDVLGLITYPRNYRNFNVTWKDAQGRFFSMSYAAAYGLTATGYSEENIFYMINDEIGGEEISGPIRHFTRKG